MFCGILVLLVEGFCLFKLSAYVFIFSGRINIFLYIAVKEGLVLESFFWWSNFFFVIGVYLFLFLFCIDIIILCKVVIQFFYKSFFGCYFLIILWKIICLKMEVVIFFMFCVFLQRDFDIFFSERGDLCFFFCCLDLGNLVIVFISRVWQKGFYVIFLNWVRKGYVVLVWCFWSVYFLKVFFWDFFFQN